MPWSQNGHKFHHSIVAVTVKPGEDSVLIASTVIANTDNAC